MQTNLHTNKIPEIPLFTFGVIADIQYADRDSALCSYGVRRQYRNTLPLTEAAFDEWCGQRELPSSPFKPSFVMQLGDLIDGWNATDVVPTEMRWHAAEKFKHIMERLPTFHLWGNHDLYNFKRGQLLSHPLLGSSVQTFGSVASSDSLQNEKNENARRDFELQGIIRSTGDDNKFLVKPESPNVFPAYYSFTIGNGKSKRPNYRPWRFIVLDTYELSVIGYEKHETSYMKAKKILDANNRNQDQNSSAGNFALWFSTI